MILFRSDSLNCVIDTDKLIFCLNMRQLNKDAMAVVTECSIK